MPYYCTVPRCTSMAGKAKNVSFHQFPRDEELAKLWNNILKRGKPYTKYSKVCSLHFKPEDYTITSAGKNKGQWRTLRKDAIPSQNLPPESPAPYQRKQAGPWVDNVQSNSSVIQSQLQQQLAQAIYVQTVLAIQAAGVPEAVNPFCNGILPLTNESPESPSAHSSKTSENERVDLENDDNDEIDRQNDNSDGKNDCKIDESDRKNDKSDGKNDENDRKTEESGRQINENDRNDDQIIKSSYKCDDCSKCFKDPDVFILHKRGHRNVQNGKENFDLNSIKPEMLKSNPILANLLKTTVEKNIFNANLLNKELLLSISSVNNYLSGVNNSVCDNYSDNSMSDNLDDNLIIDESVA